LSDSDHVQNLLIVYELNVLPTNILIIVFFLLQFKDVLYKKLLQILVGIVYAQLLKAVVLEILKAKNVQDANGLAVGARLFGLVNGRVYLLHNPYEQTTVDALDKSVAYINGLMLR